MKRWGKTTGSKDIPSPEHYERLQLLADISLRINQMETSTDVADFVCQEVKAIIGKGYVGATLMDEFTQTLSIKALRGLEDNKLISLGLRLTGTDPRKIQIPLKDIPPEDMTIYANGRFEIIEGGFYRLFARKYSRAVSTALERLFNIRFVYSMGFIYHSHHQGGVAILTDSESAVETNRVILENIVAQAAMVITRIHTEEQLRESEKRFSQVAESADEWIWEVDTEGMYSYCSPAVERMLGYKPDEMVGKKHFYDLFSPGVWEELKKAAFAAFGNKQLIKKLVNSNIHKNGKTVILETNASPMLDEKGNLLGYRGVDTDITERKQAEQELMESKALIEAVVENVPLMIFLKEAADLHFVLFNRAGEELLGYDRKTLLGKNDLDLFPPEQAAYFTAKDREVLDGKAVMLDIPEEPIVTVKKGQRLLHTRKVCIRGADGVTKYLLGISEDITERKKVEGKLRLISQHLETILAAVPDIVMEVDNNKIYTWANQMGIEFFGEDVIGKEVLYYLEGEQETYLSVQPLFNVKGETIYFESWQRRKDGEKRLLASWCRSLKDPDGNIVGVLLAAQDITERKRAESALMESEVRFRILFEKAMDGILVTDVENMRFTLANPCMLKMLGYTLEELRQLAGTDIHPYGDLPYVLDRFEKRDREGIIMDVEIPVKRKDGSVFYADITSAPFTLDNHCFLLGIFRDITDRKTAEDRIKASLAEKEVILKEIHHRVKNNMQVISSLLNLQSGFVKDREDAGMFQDSQQRIHSMALVYNKLYQSNNLAKIGFAGYITDLVADLMSSYNIGSGRITTRIEAPDVEFGLDLAIPCGLIINEVITNSLKYAFPGGQEGEIWVSIRQNDGSIEMSIGDNGVGLPQDMDVNANGTLGMKLIHTLVKHQLGGNIELGRIGGTSFHITFPIG